MKKVDVPDSLFPVSYTHLDVYKRQLSSFTVSDDVNIEYHEGKIMHISLSELLPEYKDTGVIGCLLYTSRCV